MSARNIKMNNSINNQFLTFLLLRKVGKTYPDMKGPIKSVI